MLAKDKLALEESMESVGADRIKTVRIDDSDSAEKEFFTKLAERNSAGVLVIPAEVSYSQLTSSLLTQLPWLH